MLKKIVRWLRPLFFLLAPVGIVYYLAIGPVNDHVTEQGQEVAGVSDRLTQVDARVAENIGALSSLNEDADAQDLKIQELEGKYRKMNSRVQELEISYSFMCQVHRDEIIRDDITIKPPVPLMPWVTRDYPFDFFVTDEIVRGLVKVRIKDLPTDADTVATPSRTAQQAYDVMEEDEGLVKKVKALFVKKHHKYRSMRYPVEHMKDVARVYLADPERLWVAYTTHKPAIVKEINNSRWNGLNQVHNELAYAIPFFEDLITLDQIEAIRAYQEADRLHDNISVYHKCEEYFDNERGKAVGTFKRAAHYKEHRQWAFRRYMEGGQPLVYMWARILIDIKASITPAPGPKEESKDSE